MKKFALYIIIGVVVGLCLWIGWKHTNRRHGTSQPTQSQTANTNIMNRPATNTVSYESATNKPAGMEPIVWLIMLDEYNKFKAANQPVEFTLRMLDQQQKPVPGVMVKGVLTRADEHLTVHEFIKLKPGEGLIREPLTLMSDNQGVILFKGRSGKTVELISISKEGYESQLPPEMPPLNFNPGFRNNAKGETVRDPSDFQKTKIFHLWKKGETERLVGVSCSVPVEPYGTNWYAVNL